MNPDTTDLARQAWTVMQAFMQSTDRRRALHAELDIGNDKAELLISLAQAPLTLREISRAFDVDPSAATLTQIVAGLTTESDPSTPTL